MARVAAREQGIVPFRDIHNRTCVPIKTSHSSDWRNIQIRLCALVGSLNRTQPAGGLPTQYLGAPYIDNLDPNASPSSLAIRDLDALPTVHVGVEMTVPEDNMFSSVSYVCNNLLNTTTTGVRGSNTKSSLACGCKEAKASMHACLNCHTLFEEIN